MFKITLVFITIFIISKQALAITMKGQYSCGEIRLHKELNHIEFKPKQGKYFGTVSMLAPFKLGEGKLTIFAYKVLKELKQNPNKPIYVKTNYQLTNTVVDTSEGLKQRPAFILWWGENSEPCQD